MCRHPVDPVGDQIGDRRVAEDPGPAVALIVPQRLERGRLVFGDLGHPETGERPAGGPLDLPKPVQLVFPRGPNHRLSQPAEHGSGKRIPKQLETLNQRPTPPGSAWCVRHAGHEPLRQTGPQRRYRVRRRGLPERIRQPPGHLVDAPDQPLGVQSVALGEHCPMPGGDRIDPILRADPHGEAQARQIHVVVRETARHVVQRGEPDLAGCQQHRVVLRVGVGARDQPVRDERVHEPAHLEIGHRGRLDDPPDQADDLLRRRAALALVLAGRRHTERLADVFLMNPDHGAATGRQPVVTIDDDGAFAAERQHLRGRGTQPGDPSSSQAEVLIEVVIVEPGDGGLEDVRGRHDTGRVTPLAGGRVEIQRRLRLRTGQAELPGAGQVPRVSS